MRWAIIDTDVYIGTWERGDFEAALEHVRKAFIVRHSAVVLSELRRGARTRAAGRLVETLFRLADVPWEPTPRDWWDAGALIRRIGDARGWEARKRRDFQNDALIALTARRRGATVVTANREDFELLSRHVRVSLFHGVREAAARCSGAWGRLAATDVVVGPGRPPRVRAIAGGG